MSTNKPTALSGGLVAVKGQASVAASTEPEAAGYYKSLTLKVDKSRYTRLKQLGVGREKTMQDVLTEAVDLLLADKTQVR